MLRRIDIHETRQNAIASVSCDSPGIEVGHGSRRDAWSETDWKSDRHHATEVLSAPVRAWFEETFPEGATPAQELAWPAIAAGENVLLIAPTGTGKTLAAFLAILDQLFRPIRESLAHGVRCVYVSPLRSLNYDIERNLQLAAGRNLPANSAAMTCPVRVGVRTGDTSAS